MRTPHPLLKKSFAILHSLPWVVFSAYLLNEALHGRIDFSLLIIFVAIKIYVYSGVFGALIEIASGETILSGIKRVVHNANRSWAVYLLLIMIPFLIRLALVAVFPYFDSIPPDIFAAHSDLFIFYLLAHYLIRKKYKKDLRLERQNIRISLRETSVLVMLHTIQMILFYIPQFIPAENAVANIARFFSIYFHLLLFLYIANSLLQRRPEIKRSFSHPKELYLISTATGKVINSLIHSLMSRGRPAVFFVPEASFLY